MNILPMSGGLAWIFVAIVIIAVFVFLVRVTANARDDGGTGKRKALYHYKRRDWFVSKVEHDCFAALVSLVGHEYYIFPQVHLEKIIDWKVPGQDWKFAMRHINQKSVDFLLCDKNYLRPVLGIELDDATHARPDRIERDSEVERILKNANFPLLRLHLEDIEDPSKVTQMVRASLS